MPDLSTNVAAGQAGHPALHNDERTEINAIRSRLTTVEGAAGASGSLLQSYKGRWLSGTTYAAGDIVQRLGNTYLATASTSADPGSTSGVVTGGQSVSAGAYGVSANRVMATIKINRTMYVSGIELGAEYTLDFRRIGISVFQNNGLLGPVLAVGEVDSNTGGFPRFVRINFAAPVLLSAGQYSVFMEGREFSGLQFTFDNTPPVYTSPSVQPDYRQWFWNTGNSYGGTNGTNYHLRYRLLEITGSWIPITTPTAPVLQDADPRLFFDGERLEPLPPALFTGGNVPLNNGWSIFQMVTARRTFHISGVEYFMVQASAGQTASRVALYEYDLSTNSWVRRTRSTSSSAFTAANSQVTLGFEQTWLCLAGRRYAFAFLNVGASTVPTIQGRTMGTGVGNSMRKKNTAFATGVMTSQTDLPLEIADGDISSNYDNALLMWGYGSSSW